MAKAKKAKAAPSDLERLVASQFGEMTPATRILTAADKAYIRGLVERGFSESQILQVVTSQQYSEAEVRAVIQASAARKAKAYKT